MTHDENLNGNYFCLYCCAGTNMTESFFFETFSVFKINTWGVGWHDRRNNEREADYQFHIPDESSACWEGLTLRCLREKPPLRWPPWVVVEGLLVIIIVTFGVMVSPLSFKVRVSVRIPVQVLFIWPPAGKTKPQLRPGPSDCMTSQDCMTSRLIFMETQPLLGIVSWRWRKGPRCTVEWKEI